MGARAQELVDAIAASGANAEIVALCDAYRGRAERGKARAGGAAAIVDDYRRILDDRAVDAVFIATPDHWHRRMAIDAVVGRQGRLHREADDLHGRRRPRDHRRRRQGTSGSSRSAARASAAQRQATARELVKSGRLGAITLIRADEPPQLRQRRLALSHPARRLAADRELGAVPRLGATAAVQPGAVLPVALLLGLLRRTRHRPLRPPPQLDPLRHGRPGARRAFPARAGRSSARRRTKCPTRCSARSPTPRASPPSSRARSTARPARRRASRSSAPRPACGFAATT